MAQLKFYKLSAETMATKTVEAGAIWFNKTLKTIEVYNGTSWEKFAGSLQDATWANDKLTIKKYDGSSVELDFSDVASTSSVVTALSNLKAELLGTAEDTADKVTIYGVKAYAKAQAEAAQSAAEGHADRAAATAKSEAIAAVVGTATDTKDSKTIEGVRKYVEDKTSGIASDAVVTGINNRLVAVENDYLKNADKEALQGAINTEKDRVDAIENDYLKAADKTELANSIKAISNDYLKAADKTELADRITNEAPVTMAETAGAGDILKTYTFTQNGKEIGKINLAKDLVVSGGQVVEKEGVKYLQLTIANQSEPVEIAVSDLVDVYIGSEFVNISDTNVISVDKDGIIAGLATDANAQKYASDAQSAAEATAAGALEAAIATEVTRANGAYESAGAAAAVKEELTGVITENERVTAEGLTDLDTRLKSIEGAVNTESSVAEQISTAVTPVANRVTDLETAVNTTIPGQIAALDAAAVKSVSGSDYIEVTGGKDAVVAAKTLAVADSTENSNGLATAYDVKSYVQSHVAAELAWVEFE